MKRTIIILAAILALAILPLAAQTTGDYNYHKAIDLLDKGGDPKEARQLVTELLEENPKHIQSYLLLASLDRHDKDYASAMKQIDQAMKMNHKKSDVCNSTLLWWKASIYSDVKEMQKAVEAMTEAVAVARKKKSEYVPAMLQDLGQYYYQLKDYNSSDKCYEEAFKLDESDLSSKVGIARNMIDRQNYDEALAILDECRRYDSGYTQVYKYQVLAYEGKKEYRKMIDAMVTLYEKSEDSGWLESGRFLKDKKYSFALVKEKIAEGKDDFIWRAMLAELYDECHMNKELLVSINGLLADYGDNPELLEKRADVYEEMGLYEEALKDLDRALDMDKENAVFYHADKYIVYRSVGRYDEAEAEIEKFIERYPRDAYGYYAKGWCRELSGDEQGAMAAYEDGIAVDDEYPYIYLMRANMNLKWGKEELAKEDCRRIIDLDTLVEDGSCRHYALHILGRDDEAMEWMEKILESDPDNPGHWYDKSCLMCRMGRLEEAVEALNIAFEKGYRRFNHIEHDDDVDAIRGRDDFKVLVEAYMQKYEQERMEIYGKAVVESESMVTEVAMQKRSSGTYEVPCSVNGLSLKMIFDTGASDVTISSVEAGFMLKNGYLSDGDVKGKSHYMTASGDIHEGTILRLKEVKLGDAVLKNVEASVEHSQKAPLLLGQSVLEKFGTITIDNVNSKLIIKQ